MKFSVTLERDEDGVWIAECPAISGCVSQGRSKDEALKNVTEAIALCLEVRAEQGLPFTWLSSLRLKSQGTRRH